MSFFVYIHTCPNGKRYVGVTTQTEPEHRWREGHGYHHNLHFIDAIKKYGWDNIEHTSFKTKSKDLMMFWERTLIYYYNTTDRKYGYNKTSGGDSCFVFSDEHKRKISIALKGTKRRPLSDEHKRKISESMKGIVHSEDAKKKMSIAHKGTKRRPLSDEHKRKISEGGKGKKRNEDTRRKISEATKLYWKNKRKNNI